jgi:hypothetical protein
LRREDNKRKYTKWKGEEGNLKNAMLKRKVRTEEERKYEGEKRWKEIKDTVKYYFSFSRIL